MTGGVARVLCRAWLSVGVLAVLGSALVPSPTVAGNVVFDAIGLGAMVALLVGIRVNRPARASAWYLLLAGQVCWVLGDITYGVHVHVLGIEPFPSLADAFYLGGYAPLAWGLYLLARGRGPTRDRAPLLDAGIVATGLGLVVWTYVMRPVAVDDTLTGLTRIISLGYPMVDVLLITITARLFTRTGSRVPSYRLLTAGLAVLLTADLAYGALTAFYDQVGLIVDPLYLLAYVLMAGAALHPSMRTLADAADQETPAMTGRRLLFLAVTSMLAPALLFVQGLTAPADLDWAGIGIGAVILFLLVLARLAGLARQVQDQADRLARLAHLDPLTGVANRRSWDRELDREITRARRRGGPLTIAMIDMDHFKAYNDRYGHPAGDRLLRRAVALWSDELREYDLLARYGGEEFGVILGDSDPERAAEVVQRLLGVTPDGQTCSAGVAAWDGHEPAEHLVARADAALYRAKAEGRNRVVGAAPPDRPDVVAGPVPTFALVR
jgi:diguanylate cyclase (GGDEF)-like protein